MMKKFMTVWLAVAFSIGLASTASAGNKHGRDNKEPKELKPQRKEERLTLRTRHPRPAPPDRSDHQDNFGRRRSALAHHQNAERRALYQQQKEERRLARGSGTDRRDLAHQQREERRQLRQHQQQERKNIRR
jgi:hypothetical protein